MIKHLIVFVLLSSFLFSQEWEYSSQLPNGNPPRKICTDSKNVYCYSSGKFYKSIDDGINWEETASFTKSVIKFINCDSVLFVGGLDGLYRSSDEGGTWNLLENNIPASRVYDIYIHDINIYVSYGNVIYLSSNYGYEWNLISTFKNNEVLELAANDDLIIVGLDNDQILLSESLGKEWTEPDSVLTLHGSDISNIILNDTVVYIITLYDEIWYSPDLCQNWNTYLGGYNKILKSGKEFIIGQSEVGHFLNAYKIHGILDKLSTLPADTILIFNDFSDNDKYIFGITDNSIFRSSKCIFQVSPLNIIVDSSYCLTDTCFIKTSYICGYKNKLKVNDGLYTFYEFDSKNLVFPDTGIYKFTYYIQNSYIESYDTTQFYITVLDNPEKPTITMSNDTLYSSSDYGNQWYHEDTLIAGAVGQWHYPLFTGNYTVQIGKDKCISDMSEVYFVEFVSVEETTTTENISISPNPATDYIEVGGVGDVKIYDVLGNVVIALGDELRWSNGTRLRGNDILVSSEGNVRIDVSSLSPGVYFVKVGGKMLKFY